MSRSIYDPAYPVSINSDSHCEVSGCSSGAPSQEMRVLKAGLEVVLQPTLNMPGMVLVKKLGPIRALSSGA